MITFILIFFVLVITVGALSVIGFAFYLKRRNKSLETNNPKQFIDEPPPYRSLFASTDEEIHAQKRAESAAREAKTADAVRQTAAEKIEAVRGFRQIWIASPTKQNTLELFRFAAESGRAEIFSETAETVIEFRRENKVSHLTAHNLADLLDSHLRILPQQERLSGAIFWIRREIENLRRESEEV